MAARTGHACKATSRDQTNDFEGFDLANGFTHSAKIKTK
jgi:hypothetical protein